MPQGQPVGRYDARSGAAAGTLVCVRGCPCRRRHVETASGRAAGKAIQLASDLGAVFDIAGALSVLEESCHRRCADRVAQVLRPQYLVQPPFEPTLVAGPNDCLVLVSVSTPASGQRQPLRWCRTG
jgi:hypothetical protein